MKNNSYTTRFSIFMTAFWVAAAVQVCVFTVTSILPATAQRSVTQVFDLAYGPVISYSHSLLPPSTEFLGDFGVGIAFIALWGLVYAAIAGCIAVGCSLVLRSFARRGSGRSE